MNAYKDFFYNFKTMKERYIQQGTNDYNPYLAITQAHYENTLHSNLIYSFLNIHGTHYQKSLFLDELLQLIEQPNLFENMENIKVYKEYSIENGRLDLYIHDNNSYLVIENEICAQEHNNQLIKYAEFLAKQPGIRKKFLYF
ncbi:hypothetical protein HpCK35_31100 [Helicobacter pylori]